MKNLPCMLTLPLLLCGGCVHWDEAALDTQEAPVSLLVIADPQFHNMQGATLKSIRLRSSRFVKQAMRPPEMNLLSKYVMAELVSQAREEASDKSLAVLLGDVGDIGCSGEFDTLTALDTTLFGDDTALLIAHGNHDSYLQGTLNSIHPGKYTIPPEMAQASLPVDVSFWPEPMMTDPERTWHKACWPGTPMNKVSWIAKYMKLLSRHGVSFEADGSTEVDGFEYLDFSARPPAEGPLANRNYELRGSWVKPEPNAHYSYRSFVVQAVDVGPKHRLVLIDTSTCPYRAANVKYPFYNAGSRGCIGRRQLDVIQALVDANASGDKRALVFAGHFPLEDITRGDRRRLRSIMAQQPQATYLSGHSHKSLRMQTEGNVVEYNVGSTTDWPMEANVFNFFEATPRVVPHANVNLTNSATQWYLRAAKVGDMELCRHLAAARKLAEMKVTELGDTWESPNVDKGCDDKLYDDAAAWTATRSDLERYIREIDRRYNDPSDTGYRQAVLGVAASATQYFDQYCDWYGMLAFACMKTEFP